MLKTIFFSRFSMFINDQSNHDRECSNCYILFGLQGRVFLLEFLYLCNWGGAKQIDLMKADS